ncbi:hypothetical protein L1987_45404 [Smallanthus sonchifolius]|uniref:Uncharacterized protein n=1 Tax=Smallanthus sonchifolius TaxID=185202 RepID=A0ACB9FXH3_9ASTR|nr:hypothetical protein L1987_45404 [Smallanthus sonchifolius]
MSNPRNWEYQPKLSMLSNMLSRSGTLTEGCEGHWKSGGLKGLDARLKEIRGYLDLVIDGKLPLVMKYCTNYRFLALKLQDMFNLMSNLNVADLIKTVAVKTNDQLPVIYLSSLIRSVIALHNLINNKMRNIGAPCFTAYANRLHIFYYSKNVFIERTRSGTLTEGCEVHWKSGGQKRVRCKTKGDSWISGSCHRWKTSISHEILYQLQDVFNLMSNLNVTDLIKTVAVKTNDQLHVIYLSSLIRSVIALHNLINNKDTLRSKTNDCL